MTEMVESVFGIVWRLLCGVTGHDRLLQFDRQRISLRCIRCGHETRGWTIGAEPESGRTVLPPSSQSCMEGRRAA
jgi:hypothetical protein